jgi:two-component system chemotaxis sensor kinase CheA
VNRPRTHEQKIELLQEAQRLTSELERVLPGAGDPVPKAAIRHLRVLATSFSSMDFTALARLADTLAASDSIAVVARGLAGLRDRIGALIEDLDADVGVESLLRELLSPTGGFPAGEAAVASTAKFSGKIARLSTECAPEDAAALEALRLPLLHLLRNAVDHGIEAPAERRRRGKPETGTVTLRARREGERFVVEIEDDGRGVDFVTALDRARRLHLPRDTAPEELIFLPGFTTRPDAGEISGRGIGLDAARQIVRGLGGDLVLVRSTAAGTLFRMEAPVAALAGCAA